MFSFSWRNLFICRKANHPEIHRLFPNVNIQYVEGAGHWVHSEKPNEFLKIIMEFLNEQSWQLSYLDEWI